MCRGCTQVVGSTLATFIIFNGKNDHFAGILPSGSDLKSLAPSLPNKYHVQVQQMRRKEALRHQRCSFGQRCQEEERDMGPAAALALTRHEFGEHGGVNLSIEAFAAFTDMESEILR
ncbi:hypothetical protein VIGAN_01048000 [Vigna angularis var. angularis]|uniref:Uncharacterized protein n=1 Tax=Vigna angularis var. angularis TaxID=157739 RepID=A0A0S3QXG7_PHAAN|nr:hypothetical protein VIGAN_01048000 [Vigna angularis var. angularis]